MYQKVSTYNPEITEMDINESLIEMYYDKIYKYCYSMLRNTHDAEDAVQEVFFKAMKSGKVSKVENQNAWLYKISYFHCMNKIKRQKLLAFIPFIDNENSSLAIEIEFEDELQSILTRLKPEERALIILRIVENYSFEEIAQILDKPSATVRKRYERVKGKIKNLL